MDILYQLYLQFFEKLGVNEGFVMLSWHIFPFIATICAMLFVTVVVALFEKKLLVYFLPASMCSVERKSFGVLLKEAFAYLKDGCLEVQGTLNLFYYLAPVTAFCSVFILWGLIPYSNKYIPLASDAGVILFVSLVAISFMSFLFAGLGSGSKFALVSSMRFSSLAFSVIVPIAVTVLGAIVLSSSVNINEIVLSQSSVKGLPGWYFIPAIIGFLVVFVSLVIVKILQDAEFTPDNPNNYAGAGFAFFYVSKYTLLFILCAFTVCLFAGGYLPPFGKYIGEAYEVNYILNNSAVYAEQIFWLVIKTFVLVFAVIWTKNILPKVGNDKIMITIWHVLMPLSVINFVIVCAFKVFGG